MNDNRIAPGVSQPARTRRALWRMAGAIASAALIAVCSVGLWQYVEQKTAFDAASAQLEQTQPPASSETVSPEAEGMSVPETDVASEEAVSDATVLSQEESTTQDGTSSRERSSSSSDAQTYSEETTSSNPQTPANTSSTDASTPTQQNENPVESGDKSTPAPAQPQEGSHTPPSSEPAQSKVSVTINAANAQAGTSSTTVSVKQGATVYDALKATGVSINARSTAYGVYVAGISGITEQTSGQQAGWVYAVNGVQPNVACSAYRVHDGDTIVWTYVYVS